MTTQTRLARLSSIAIRSLSWFFLRCALFPPIVPLVFTLLAAYVPLSIWGYLNEPLVEVKADEIDVVITEKAAKPDEPASSDAVEGTATIEETIVVGPKPVFSWDSLLTGAPNPRSIALSLLTLLINVACVAMVADRVFTEHNFKENDLSFARLGYVSDTEAKLLIREPDQTKMPLTVEIRIKDAVPPFDSPAWQVAGGARWTTNETDYTTVISLPLRHEKQRTYEWRTSNKHFGEFTSAPKAGTSATATRGKFTFLSTSCHVSRLPYNPFDHPLSIMGMRQLAKVLPTLNAQFMLFLGDFIYVDVPWRWGQDKTDYRQKYRQIYASPDWPAVSQNLSWIHVLDDHEISNDWDKNSTGMYAAAVDPWHHYHLAANPPAARRQPLTTALGLASNPITWFEFTQGPAAFFMMDTRSYRSSNSLPYDSPNKTMLGEAQLTDLLAFLAKPQPKGVRWKFIASSVPFTRNWRVNTRDTWGGFLVERRRILEAMWDAGLEGFGVIVLSGDRHEFAATKFAPPKGGRWPQEVAPFEFSASPLSQFFGPVPTYFQTDSLDVKIKYIHNGNSKFGAITISDFVLPNTEDVRSAMHYRLFINGEKAWSTDVVAPEKPKVVKTGAAAFGSALWTRFMGSR